MYLIESTSFSNWLLKLKSSTYLKTFLCSGRHSAFTIMASDPYTFTEESYEGTGLPDLNRSLLELFNKLSSDEEFHGFEEEDEHVGVRSQVKDSSPGRGREVRNRHY